MEKIKDKNIPLGNEEWDCTDKYEYDAAPPTISPDQKISVFISSICGDNGKYDRIRANLKQTIENTNMANVYLFEKKDASTLSAEEHYTWALEDSDLCIFLIDNADGVAAGVQKEIDTAKRHNIKSLYYFCDETTKEKTALEQSIIGATFAKSKTVHQFDELSRDVAHALVNDIMTIYSNYCRGRLVSKPEDIDTEAERKGIQELFFFLETKRILVNPIEMEIKQWCIKSAIEIKKKIIELCSQYDFSNHTTDCMRSMIDACNNFLDKLGSVKETGILYKNGNGDWVDSTFSSAMKQFRKTFRDNISLLSSAYNLTFNKNIPEQY